MGYNEVDPQNMMEDWNSAAAEPEAAPEPEDAVVPELQAVTEPSMARQSKSAKILFISVSFPIEFTRV